MTEINGFFDEANRTNTRLFRQLISDVEKILCGDKTCPVGLHVTGRLIEMPCYGELTVIGDIHGDAESLKHILQDSDFVSKASANKDAWLVFLGDYGDRGPYSPEVYFVALTLKKNFPKRVVLLQGNHEGPEDLLAHPHDLPHQLNKKFGSEGLVVYEDLSRLFREFRTAVLIKKKCVILHGGIPNRAVSLEDLAYAYRKHPLESHLEEILWSDPSEKIMGAQASPRGAGKIFGKDITERFLKLADAKILIRGHEPSEKGYKFNHNGMILTLFSRKGPPYCNQTAAYLRLTLSQEQWTAKSLKNNIHIF